MARIIVRAKNGVPIVHSLSDGLLTVGRDTDNAIIIADETVSRHHAEIRSHAGTWTLRDLNSANGSTVNGQPVTETSLKEDDIICFGMVTSIFVTEPLVIPVDPVQERAGSKTWFTPRRLLLGGIVLIVAALMVAAVWFLQRSVADGSWTLFKPAVIVDRKPIATKAYWDRIQQIESLGNQQANSMHLEDYPKLPDGMYDLQFIDDKPLGTLLDRLIQRAHNLSRVSRDLAGLDQRDVDADLVAFTKVLGRQWDAAASIDRNLANLVWIASRQRTRWASGDSASEAADDTPAPESADKDRAADLSKMTKAWLVQRDQFLEFSATVSTQEKETARRLAERYHREF